MRFGLPILHRQMDYPSGKGNAEGNDNHGERVGELLNHPPHHQWAHKGTDGNGEHHNGRGGSRAFGKGITTENDQ